MKTLIPFGENYIDPQLVGCVIVEAKPYLRPAPGQRALESAGGHGLQSLYGATAMMDFKATSAPYRSLGYETAEGARVEAMALIKKLGADRFLAVAEDIWVCRSYVRSIAPAGAVRNSKAPVVWLDYQAAAAPVPAEEYLMLGIEELVKDLAEVDKVI